MKVYADLIREVLHKGKKVKGRNGYTIQIAGASIKWDVSDAVMLFPTARKLYLYGILGELAALVRQPNHINDFKAWGCNYWDQFGDANGNLNLDYGNAWKDGVDQIARVKRALLTKKNRYNRDLMIVGWRPNLISKLTLPCCHFAYQYLCDSDDNLHLIWYQRSADIMVGVPSDIVLANVMLIAMAYETNLFPDTVTMHFGSAHIYQKHLRSAEKVLLLEENLPNEYTHYDTTSLRLSDFSPGMIDIHYTPRRPIKFECVR